MSGIPICDRCLQPILYDEQDQHGLYLCPFVARPAHYVVPDDIPGGVLIEHGLCDDNGDPVRYYSHSEIDRACAVKGMRRWSDYYEESRTKPAREEMDWQRSGEAQKLRKQNEERARDTRRPR